MAVKLEVCHAPALYEHKSTVENFITVVVDILRASTSMCVALHYGVREIVPVSSMDAARAYQKQGMLLAAEEDGVKPAFADFGNSPFDFQNEKLKGQQLVFKTTNGTGAILKAKDADEILVASFLNISAIENYLKKSEKNLVILCSGWKGQIGLEDSVFAGALAARLLDSGIYESAGDSTLAAVSLWNENKNDLKAKMKKAAHAERLQKLNLDDSHDYTFSMDSSVVLPAFKNDKLIDLSAVNI